MLCGEDDGGDDKYCGGGNVCCLRQSGSGKTMTCVGSGANACNGGVRLGCDDRSDCGIGQICCGTFDSSTGYRSSQCQFTCTVSPTPGTTSVQFCDPKNPVSECEAGKTCTLSGSLPGYSYCKAP